MHGSKIAFVVLVMVSASYAQAGMFENAPVKTSKHLLKAAEACPLSKRFTRTFLPGQDFELELRHCDGEFSNRFSKVLMGYWGSDYLFIYQKVRNTRALAATQMSMGEFNQVIPISIGVKDFVLLESEREGSGAYSDWCLLGGSTASAHIRCIKKPGDEDSLAKPYLGKDESPKAWWPAFVDGEFYLSAAVQHGFEANCCPSRGWITINLLLRGDSLKVGKVFRTKDAPRFVVASKS
jgi:hypothetical protein